MEVFEIFGLSRSGHHAMTNWLIKNMVGHECGMEWKLNIMDNGVYYINEGNLDKHLTKEYVKDHKNNFKRLFISYENEKTDFSILNKNEKYITPMSLDVEDMSNINNNYRIVFIRNFYDNLASRIKSNEINLSKSREGQFTPWDTEKDFINLWKNQAKIILENKCLFLKYEDWLTSKNIRDKFINNMLRHGEIFDNKVKGTPSSFGDNKVIDRFSQIQISEETKELIRKDNELHYLMGALGYEYREI
jgi:hypothetical protein